MHSDLYHYFLVFGTITTGVATLIGLLDSEFKQQKMHFWTLVTGLIFCADVFALAYEPTPQVQSDAPFVVAERILTPIDIDGKNRLLSPPLMKLAKEQAERNATNGNPLGHRNLDNHINQFGVMAENAGTAADWEAMYRTWRKSPDHLTNIQSGLQYMGYAVATSVSGQKCYIVVYGSRNGLERAPR